MDVILLPGLWLDASSWDEVIPHLEHAGHRPVPLTLPGVGPIEGDRAAVTVADQVAAVVRVIDKAESPVAIVAHSASGGLAHAAVDARPDRVARVFYVGGFPTGDGAPLVDAFTPHDGAIALPDRSEFDDADLTDLGDDGWERLRRRALLSPECAARDPLRLRDERRYQVPVTAVCPEYRSDALAEWIAAGLPAVREFARIQDVEMVDLVTGHWPQFTRPAELAEIVVDRLPAGVDAHGRPEPPIAVGEAPTLLGFLDYQRATLAWKCRGLGADGLRATVGVSTMTLGGLLKHLAWVEEYWFSQVLLDLPPSAPWDSVDWKADRDWEWHSAAAESPEQLFALWEETIVRTRAIVAEAIGTGGLDVRAARRWPDWPAPSLRWIVCHMIEEYARHNGHADLLRESVDGETGE